MDLKNVLQGTWNDNNHLKQSAGKEYNVTSKKDHNTLKKHFNFNFQTTFFPRPHSINFNNPIKMII